MTVSTIVPYWTVALRVGCVLSQVIAASGDLSLKLSLTPEYKFTNNGLSLTNVACPPDLCRKRSESDILPLTPQPCPEAYVNMAENIMLNRVGARTHPCLTPLVTGNASEPEPSSRTLAIMPSWNCLTTEMKIFRHPNLTMIFHSPSLLTESKRLLVKSTKPVQRSWCYFMHFHWSWLPAKIISVAPWPWRNPHWFSGRRPCSTWFNRWFRSTRTKILPAINRMEIPRCLSHDCPSVCRFVLLKYY